MLCLIGNSPSSGSTLLADLLDSTPYSACGPELEFFCNRSVYEFSDYQANPGRISRIHSYRATGIRFRTDHLSAYNLTENEWDRMLQNASSLAAFTHSLSQHFLQFRKKPGHGIMFEKTPQNVNAIDLFLKAFPQSYFIHIVRNPLAVYWSLKKRGWGNLAAWSTWLIYEAKVYPFLSHPRCLVVKYENLIQHPFDTTTRIMNQIQNDFVCTREMVKQGFKHNEYRQRIGSLQGWSNQDRTVIQPPASSPPETIVEKLSPQLDCEINPLYAKQHGMAAVTLREVMEELDYKDQIAILEEHSDDETSIPSPSLKDWRKILPKWIKSLYHGHGKVNDIITLIRPVLQADHHPKT